MKSYLFTILLAAFFTTNTYSQSPANEKKPTETMTRVLVLITLELDQLDSNYRKELFIKEQEHVQTWKKEKMLESFMLSSKTKQVILIFENISLEEVKNKIATLPFFPYFTRTEYITAEKHF